jgi:nucleoside 2-deoxyribosyltransferase
MTRIYLAAPLFTSVDRERNSALAALLSARGLQTFLPQDIAPANGPDGLDFGPVFVGCRSGVDAADAVVAIVDGLEVDSGVAWEIGYASAIGKPILCIRTDIRGGDSKASLNVMLAYSATQLSFVTSFRRTHSMVMMRIAESIADWIINLKNPLK